MMKSLPPRRLLFQRVAAASACALAVPGWTARAATGTGGDYSAANSPVEATPDLPPGLRFAGPPVAAGLAARGFWEPMLTDLARVTGQPVNTLSTLSTASLSQAVARDKVDLAFLCGGLALEAVAGGHMRVVAQPRRPGRGEPPNRAILLTRRGAGLDTTDALVVRMGTLRIARGDTRSLGGYMLPQLRVFLPRGRDMETDFRAELLGAHLETALALANGEADVATGTLGDFERFGHQFPEAARRLQVVWQSEPVPPAQFMVRSDFPPRLQRQVQAVLLGYGAAGGARQAQERPMLEVMQARAGFTPARNAAVLPVAQLSRELARQRTLRGRWVDESARRRRLARIDAEFESQQARLSRDTGV